MAATRTKFQREHDLEFISNLYLQGWTQQRIAERLASERDYEVSRVTIANDLKEVARRWQQNTTLPIDDHKVKELARIDLLEQTYWQSWEKSCEAQEAVNQRSVTVDEKNAKKRYDVSSRKHLPARDKETGDVITQPGNPAFLAGVERCIKMRMDLLGLEAPKRQEHTGKDGGAIILKTGMSMDDL